MNKMLNSFIRRIKLSRRNRQVYVALRTSRTRQTNVKDDNFMQSCDGSVIIDIATGSRARTKRYTVMSSFVTNEFNILQAPRRTESLSIGSNYWNIIGKTCGKLFSASTAEIFATASVACDRIDDELLVHATSTRERISRVQNKRHILRLMSMY